MTWAAPALCSSSRLLPMAQDETTSMPFCSSRAFMSCALPLTEKSRGVSPRMLALSDPVFSASPRHKKRRASPAKAMEAPLR